MLRISCASSWFFFTGLYLDARSTEHKILHRVLDTSNIITRIINLGDRHTFFVILLKRCFILCNYTRIFTLTLIDCIQIF